MSSPHAEQETRKRARSASVESHDAPGPVVTAMPPADVDDSDDDEIGPMPVPDGAGENGNGHAKKKKRAGVCLASVAILREAKGRADAGLDELMYQQCYHMNGCTSTTYRTRTGTTSRSCTEIPSTL